MEAKQGHNNKNKTHLFHILHLIWYILSNLKYTFLAIWDCGGLHIETHGFPLSRYQYTFNFKLSFITLTLSGYHKILLTLAKY